MSYYPTSNYTNQPAPSQQLFDNKDQTLKYIPVIIPAYGNNENHQQYSSQQQHSLNQVTPNQEFSNVQVNDQLIFSTSNLIKDKDFSQQKQLLLKIIGIFISWTILSVFLFFLLMLSVFKELKISAIYLILAICSLIAIGFLIKLGINQKYRKTESSLLILFGLICSYTLFYIGLVFFLLISVHNYSASVLIITVFQCMICFNFVTNFIILIYLFFERTKIRVIYVCLVQIAIIVLLGILYLPFFYLIIVVLPYPICILNAFKQILKGRFNLQSNEVVTASIAVFYGMFVGCED
ncbi:unnamed protein product [Paramecium sonneborni]|uniref:Transmembrane protein n=1 Tax=Paramecium sonneborni TaxID=65129 RepID=A0A8S1Q359_9CILI|nr:unnamed protein product [Paramecium sonneborni]